MSELDDYDYALPREWIAQQPLACRSDARLMVVDRRAQTVAHHHVRDLGEFLRPGDRLVLNDTRVVPAALAGYRTQTGGHWSGLFLTTSEEGLWKVLGKTRGKLAVGETITLTDRAARDAGLLRLVERQDGGVWLAAPEPAEDAFAVLDRVGRVPLPHYIRGGEMLESDVENYQTVYAKEPGSVAAPTAGLHFTKDLLARLAKAGIQTSRVTLHVGMGTFRPITTDTLAEHKMHSEWLRVTAETAHELRECRAGGGRIVAVGTTAVRALESAAQADSLAAWQGSTDLFIRPPYEFRAVDALMTNFHLPRSTLLVLVRTFGGDALVRRAYDEAIREEYRFYSYGDAMLIL